MIFANQGYGVESWYFAAQDLKQPLGDRAPCLIEMYHWEMTLRLDVRVF